MKVFYITTSCLVFFLMFNFSNMGNNGIINKQKNVLGENLKLCCNEPKTGFYRDGFCNTGPQDYGTHTVCAVMTKDFLDFTLTKGNDLCSPKPQYNFPGLKPGDKWCLCALRWHEAYKAGYAPNVILEATNKKTLDHIPIEALKEKAITNN